MPIAFNVLEIGMLASPSVDEILLPRSTNFRGFPFREEITLFGLKLIYTVISELTCPYKIL